MVIIAIKSKEVLEDCRRKMGLPEGPHSSIEDTLLATLLRRGAGILCPCSRAVLKAALLESVQYLNGKSDTLSGRIDEIIERLIIGGDLLELCDVTTEEMRVNERWVFAAPPSYIVRRSGNIFLTGIVQDQETFLHYSLSSRINYEGVSRIIVPKPGENLARELHELGLQELSENSWLKSPKVESAQHLINDMERRLESQVLNEKIEGLQILDPDQRVTYYRQRWAIPDNRNGTFVARRPQEYGAPIWCFVRLTRGRVVRLLDLPLKKTRWRGCDVAWHLQMAIDHCRKSPQLYRSKHIDDAVRLDFFSPLPLWSHRRLMIIGHHDPDGKELFSYRIPNSEWEAEKLFLQKRLWLESTEDSDNRGE